MVSLRRNNTLGTAFGMFLLAAGLAAGCSNVESVPASDPLATEEGFCQALAQAKCTDGLVNNCYNSDASSLDQDRTACVRAASDTNSCNPQALPYHEAEAQNTLDAVKSIYSDGNLDKEELGPLADALAQVFYKGGGSGSSCEADTDCDAPNGLRCVIQSGKGSCAVPVPVTAGSSCVQTGSVCDTGYYCDPGQHCVQDQMATQDCSAGQECGEGLRCANHKSCVFRAPNGHDCSVGDDCSGGFCIKPTGDATTGVCGSHDGFEITSQSCDSFR